MPADETSVRRLKVGPVTMTPLLTPDDVSRHLGVPTGTLANWRYQGQGPAFVRVGRHVRYRARDIDEWINNQLALARRDQPPPASRAGIVHGALDG